MLIVGTNGLALIRQDIYQYIMNSISAFRAYFPIRWTFFFYLICWGCFFRLALYVTQKYLPTNQNKNNGLGCVTGICFCFSSRLGFFHRNTLICLSHSKINNLVGFSWNT
jgi:hypothetical protein